MGSYSGGLVVILMILATVWALAQLSVLSLGTRTVRTTTLLLVSAAGAYGCGALAVVLEIAYTRLRHAIIDQPLYEIVETAS